MQSPFDKTTGMLALPDQKDNIEMQEKQVITDPFGNFCLDCIPPDWNHRVIVKGETATR